VNAATNCELQMLSKRDLGYLILDYPDIKEELQSVALNRRALVQRYA
jgi:hypothetical protein